MAVQTGLFLVWFRLMLNVLVNKFSVMLGMEPPLPGYYQYFWGVNMSCSRTQHGDLSGARTPTSGSRVRGVNHQTTVPPSAWFVSDLVGNPKDRFSCNTAHMMSNEQSLAAKTRYIFGFFRQHESAESSCSN